MPMAERMNRAICRGNYPLQIVQTNTPWPDATLRVSGIFYSEDRVADAELPLPHTRFDRPSTLARRSTLYKLRHQVTGSLRWRLPESPSLTKKPSKTVSLSDKNKWNKSDRWQPAKI